MPVGLSREQVLHIAELAKLDLTDEEIDLFARQLSEILDYAEILNRLETDSIPPTAQAIEMRNVTRPDCVQDSLSPEEALANASDRHGDFFRIKAVFD